MTPQPGPTVEMASSSPTTGQAGPAADADFTGSASSDRDGPAGAGADRPGPSASRMSRRLVVYAGSATGFAGVAASRSDATIHPDRFDQLVAVAACLGFVLMSGLAVGVIAAGVRRVVELRAGSPVAHILRMLVTVSGYLVILVGALLLLHLPIGQLLLSGAVTGVLLGIAAQQSLANAFAGIFIILAAPFRVGDRITLRSGTLGGQYDGRVHDISLAYTTLETSDGPMSFANAVVLTAAVGPQRGPRTHTDSPATAATAATASTPAPVPGGLR